VLTEKEYSKNKIICWLLRLTFLVNITVQNCRRHKKGRGRYYCSTSFIENSLFYYAIKRWA